MRVLERIAIQNFKSIRSQELALGRLNVFIGGNGAGKSNLIQAFRLLRKIVERKLAEYSLKRGADRIATIFPSFRKRLHGPTVAQRIGLPRLREECPHFNEWITLLVTHARIV